jgi:ATP-binding cassette subfamily B (MDR/TAP) protein 1
MGIMFAHMIKLLFSPLLPCTDGGSVPKNFDTCAQYVDAFTDDMKKTSYEYGSYWFILVAGCVIGSTVSVYGFGKASERLNKRVRDSAFEALIRQEIAFFDKRSVGSISSQLEDDAARVHTFAGDPIRDLTLALCSILVGVIVSFAAMWPFALVSLGTIPFMAVATSLEMARFLGTDQGTDNQDELNSPGGIAVETLLNIRTVAALSMENSRYENYVYAVHHFEPTNIWKSLVKGLTTGLGVSIQQWSNALLFWWGGYLLYHYPDKFSFDRFLVSMFSLLFALFGLGAAFTGVADKKKCQEAIGRIFYLMKRQSLIDPLSEEEKKL